MDSNDDPDGLEGGSHPISDAELERRSKVSPHLRAAIMEWELRKAQAREAGAVPADLEIAPVMAVLIELNGADTSELQATGVAFQPLFGFFHAAKVALDRLEGLAGLNSVKHIHIEREAKPALDDSIPEIRASGVRNPQFPFSTGDNKYTGKNVVIGIIDSGINYFHPDFRLPNDQKQTRILAILDQTDNNKIYTKAEIETAIQSNTELIPPGRMVGTTRVETESNDHKHGTLVAGIAAGTGIKKSGCSDPYTYVGVAPEAQLVIVKFDFSLQTANMLAAFKFIEDTAKAAGLPCVINMSWGHSIGPHDGTDPVDQAVDKYLNDRDARPGPKLPLVLVAAAGNSGGHQGALAPPMEDQDSHVMGAVPANGERSIAFKLYDVRTEHGKKLQSKAEIRYVAANAFKCELTPPGKNIDGNNVLDGAANAGFTEKTQNSACSIEADADGPKRRITITVMSDAGKKNQPGEWMIKLTNASTGDVRYHGWIAGDQGDRFLGPDLSRSYTIKSPGSATNVITVANYHSSGKDKGKIADSSSRGPRIGDPINPQIGDPIKPEISAPGEDICAAKRDFNEGCCCDCCCASYTDRSGTSMAAPHVTGAIALMLQRNNALTHQEVKRILMAPTNARRDAFTGAGPLDFDFGSGKLDVVNVLNDPRVAAGGPAVLAEHSVSGARVSVLEEIVQELPGLPQLEEGTPLWRLLQTTGGQRLYWRGRSHWEEIRALVNGNKRIATVWHRNHGPLLMHHVTRTTMLPHVALPREIDGEEIAIRAARLVSALERHASKELIRALHETLPLIAQLQGKTLLEVVEMFETKEATEPKEGCEVLEHA